ncbi:MAG: transthyretin-like family protein [Planctomycetota bacterium]|jgi:hypothetical protein
MNRTTLNLVFANCLVLVVVMMGCGGSGQSAPVPTASVSGKVTLDGKPLNGATVTFFTDQWSSVGKTNNDGEFKLVQGAAVGENKVTISKVDKSRLEGVEFSENPEDGLDEGQLAAANLGDASGAVGIGDPSVPLGELIGGDYSNPGSTILTFNVSEAGTTEATFDLTAD